MKIVYICIISKETECVYIWICNICIQATCNRKMFVPVYMYYVYMFKKCMFIQTFAYSHLKYHRSVLHLLHENSLWLFRNVHPAIIYKLFFVILEETDTNCNCDILTNLSLMTCLYFFFKWNEGRMTWTCENKIICVYKCDMLITLTD